MELISRQIGEYKHPGDHRTPNEEWYRCEYRNQPVYLYVQVAADGSPPAVKEVLQFAYERQSYGVRLIRNATTRRPQIETCDFKPFMPRFNSQLEPVVNCEDVQPRHPQPESFPSNLRLVTVDDQVLVYKFMDENSHQYEFEAELRRYPLLKGFNHVPEFRGLVRRDGNLVRFLITYIEGDNLYNLLGSRTAWSEDELLRITRGIVEIAGALEERNFYHQDLNLQNTMMRLSDRALFFIDFGVGITRGMFNPEREKKIMFEGPEAVDALYILGMTLWWLWNIDYKESWMTVEFARTKNPFVRVIIDDCILGHCESINELHSRHYTASSGKAVICSVPQILNGERMLETSEVQTAALKLAQDGAVS